MKFIIIIIIFVTTLICVRGWCVQGLHTSKKKEQETEEHMLKLAELEEGRLKQEINKMQKHVDDLKEKQNAFEVLLLLFF